MTTCKACGSTVPNEQSVCFVCYGNPDYHRDEYYQRLLKEAQLRLDVLKTMEEVEWEEEDYSLSY